MNKNILLGLGAIGGAVYLATSKKAQVKVKKTTGLSDKGEKYPKNYLSPFKYKLKAYDNDGVLQVQSSQKTKKESDKILKEYLNRSNIKEVMQKKIPLDERKNPSKMESLKGYKTFGKNDVIPEKYFNPHLKLTEREFQIQVARKMLDWGIDIERINHVINRYWHHYKLSATDKTPYDIAVLLKDEHY